MLASHTRQLSRYPAIQEELRLCFSQISELTAASIFYLCPEYIIHVLIERGVNLVTVGNKLWCKRIKESLQHESEYKCYGQSCKVLETCLCKLLCPFLHKMERALDVWLEDGDEGWHNTTQGGVYRVTEEGKAIDDYLFSSLRLEPPSLLCTLRHSITLTTSSQENSRHCHKHQHMSSCLLFSKFFSIIFCVFGSLKYIFPISSRVMFSRFPEF